MSLFATLFFSLKDKEDLSRTKLKCDDNSKPTSRGALLGKLSLDNWDWDSQTKIGTRWGFGKIG